MIAALIVTSSAMTNLALDVGLNTLQNWGGTFYTDAFWSKRQPDSPQMRQLAREEADIDRLLRTPDFGVAQTGGQDGADTQR